MFNPNLIVFAIIGLGVLIIFWAYHRSKRAKEARKELRQKRISIARQANNLRWGASGAESVYQLELLRSEVYLLLFHHGNDTEVRSDIVEARWRIEDDIRNANRGWRETPYATEDELAHACAVLSIDPSVTIDAINRAYVRTVAPYNLPALRKQNPPAGVLQTARKRKLEAYKALRLLRGYKRFLAT